MKNPSPQIRILEALTIFLLIYVSQEQSVILVTIMLLKIVNSVYFTQQEARGTYQINKLPWWFGHDVQVRGVEPEGGGGQAIGDQVDPQKLYRNQSLGQTKSGSQEN